MYRSKKDNFQKSNDYGDENGLSTMHENRGPKINEADLNSRKRKEEVDTGDKDKLHSSSEGEVIDQDTPKTTTSDEGVSEDGVENVKPFYYRFISPPYVRQPVGKEKSSTEEPTTAGDKIGNEKNNKSNDPAGESKPKPRSVRRRPLKPPAGSEGLSNSGNDGVAANISPISVKRDEEDKTTDELLMHYSKKSSPSESVSKYKGNLPLPPGRQKAEYASEGSSFRSKNSDPISPLGLGRAAASFTEEAKSPTEAEGRRNNRASSLQPDMCDGHVHPKLPEYDDLATRLAALRRG